MKKLFAGLLILVSLQACANTPEMKWAESQNLYNNAVGIINEYRAPCVVWSGIENAGPDHPKCYISDDTMRRLAPVRDAADALLNEMARAAATGDSMNYGNLTAQFDALITQLLTEATLSKQEKFK